MEVHFFVQDSSFGDAEKGIKKDVVDAQTLLCILPTCELSQLFLLRFPLAPRSSTKRSHHKTREQLGFVYPHILYLRQKFYASSQYESLIFMRSSSE